MGTSYRLVVAFANYVLAGAAAAVPVVPKDATLQLVTAYTLQASSGACPITPQVANLAYSAPAWMTAGVGVWAQIAGTSVPTFAKAYCGLALRQETGRIEWYAAALGGHIDNPSDNTVYSVRLDGATPVWNVLRSASSTSGWDATGNSGRYMPDGRPAPSHTYWGSMWVAAISRVVTFGAYYVGTNVNTYLKVDGFNPATNDWDAAGTWPDMTNTYYAASQNSATGEIYALQSTGIIKWAAANLTATGIALSGGTAQRGGQAWDSSRSRIYHLCSGDNYSAGSSTITSFQANPATGAVTAISFNSSAAWTDFQTNAPGFLTTALAYDPDLDYFYFYNGGAEGTQKIYRIKPNAGTTWDMDFLPASGVTPARSIDASNGGVMNKFAYVSALKCCILAVGGQSIYYIRTQ